ncbi:acetate--CoA ligase family protein [Variovorax sp.]|jgi:acyl-CoA synthetase (NDP forming)|uniref:acetate--CoA ligase family protein n=1 Tax=Variovorax sp. TaxID=1871043 RepID=UPI000C493B76|nr:acetate--CoA ligase family protein [Variovorax sp.]MBS77746.1 CoA-binding protein [Variovorax sp.]
MNPLKKGFAPASIAVLGASDNPHKVGGRPIAFMKQYGYRGRVYPVNAARAEVQGLEAYASLDRLPEVPELVVVAIGGEEGASLVEQAAAAGVAVAVVMASGYAEGGAEGLALQQRMVAACRRSGMRLVGPNCQGLSNFSNGAIANFSTIFHEAPGQDGPLAIIGQSGAATQSVYALAHRRGIHARYVHATGNEADVTVGELLLEVVHDPDIRAVVLYLEAMKNVEQLAQAAAMANVRGLPIIAIKGGRSENGQRAASSHTGAMATEDRVVDAFFEHHNIVRAIDPYDAVSLAALFIGAPAPRGSNLVAMSNSGASCVMAADTADEMGLPLLDFDEATAHCLDAVLPVFSQGTNPVDLTGALLTDRALFGGAVAALAKAPELHLLMVSFPIAGTGYDVPGYARALADFVRETGVTVAVSAYQETVRAEFAAAGLVTFDREREALHAIQVAARHSAGRQRAAPRREPVTAVAVPIVDGQATLDEAQSLELLRAAGVETVAFELCRTEEQAIAALHRLGGRVVLKACSPDLTHKSEHGLVALDLMTEDQVRDAMRKQAAIVRSLGARHAGALVAKMHKGGRELALGARVDPVFGPVVLIGDGGIYLEALKDFRLLVAPFSEDDVARALTTLRIAPVLAGVRGELPSDTAAFCRMAVRLGDAALQWKDGIAAIDINPVKVFEQGHGAIALDAVVEFARGTSGTRA